MKNYCIQNSGNCSTCSLVNYGRDCQNNLITDLGLEPDQKYMNPHTGTVQSGAEWQDDRDSMTDEQWGDSDLINLPDEDV